MNHQETTVDAVKLCKDLIEAFVPEKQNNISENEFNSIKHQIENLCMNCDECYDLDFYSQVMFQLYTGKINLLNAKQQINSWKISTNVDYAWKSLATTNFSQFEREKFNTSNPLIYLDQNVISKCVNDSEIKNRILNIKNSGNFQFVYSPSHIEEVYKIEDTVKQSTFCEVITEITSNVSVQPESDENMMICIESPYFALNRIKQSDGSTQAVENIKLLHNDKRKLYFEKYNTDKHKKDIVHKKGIFDSMSDENFAELMVFCGEWGCRKTKFQNITTRIDIQNSIYTLHNALDLFSYKKENDGRHMRSAVHDIEHLIYATKCNYFVTFDTKLLERAKEIFSFMKIKTVICKNIDELE